MPMRIKKMFLNIYISLSIAVAIALFCFTILGAVMFSDLADVIAMWIQKIINGIDGNYVAYEDVIDNCKTVLLAVLFFGFVFGVLKCYVTSIVIKYYSMSYTEFYTARYRYLGWIFAEFFTFNVLIDIICAVIALFVKNKEDVETEKQLATQVTDLRKDTYVGGSVGGAQFTVSTNLTQSQRADWAKNVFNNADEDMRKARDLLDSHAISQRQYNKIVKDIKKRTRK